MAVLTIGAVWGVAARREELVEALLELQAATRQEPGCVGYVVAAALEDRDTFSLHGHFTDGAALSAHYATPAFAAYQQRLDGLLARPSTLEVFEVERIVRPVASGPMDPRLAD